METLIRINNQTVGRDKIARLLQYLSRVLWHRLQINSKDGVTGLKNLEYQLSTFRKLLRLGRCVDTLYATLPLFQHKDTTVRISLILSKICNALFLFADHILWLGRSDLYQVNTDKWGRISNKYWLYSITMNLVRDFYEIVRLLKLNKQIIIPEYGIRNSGDLFKAFLNSFAIVQNNKGVLIDTVKNGCDFFIPFTALGYVKLSPGTVGLLGVISSVAGLMVLVDPGKKLSPA